MSFLNIPAVSFFSGSSGSGKTCLLANLLSRAEFYKDYFHHIFLFSPTGASDDIYDACRLPPENVFVDLRTTDKLEAILDKQEAVISKDGIDKAPRILLIFDDIQSNRKFMNSRPFLRSFIANRHFNASTWLCGQSFTRTPRACRLQANNLFYFQGSGSERDIILKEFCPPGMKKPEFGKIVDYCTEERYSFMHVNKREPFDSRYRKNLDEIITG